MGHSSCTTQLKPFSILKKLRALLGPYCHPHHVQSSPIDVLVNGKFVAKGEVVVIEENFAIRVTEIIKD